MARANCEGGGGGWNRALLEWGADGQTKNGQDLAPKDPQRNPFFFQPFGKASTRVFFWMEEKVVFGELESGGGGGLASDPPPDEIFEQPLGRGLESLNKKVNLWYRLGTFFRQRFLGSKGEDHFVGYSHVVG